MCFGSLSEDVTKMMVPPQPANWKGQGEYVPNSNAEKISSEDKEEPPSKGKKAASNTKKSRRGAGNIANRYVLAGPNIYFNSGQAAGVYKGNLKGKVTNCRPSIVIKWDSSMETDQGEKVQNTHTRTSFATDMKRDILLAVEEYSKAHSMPTSRKRTEGRSAISKLKKTKRQTSETPNAVKQNPMKVAKKPNENTQERSMRKNKWINVMRSSTHSISNELNQEAEICTNDTQRQSELYAFRQLTGKFEIPNDLTTNDNHTNETEPMYNDFESYFEDNYRCPAKVIEENECIDDQHYNKFIEYEFNDTLDDELPDCDAEDYEEYGLDGISADMEEGGYWENNDVRLNYKFEDIPQEEPQPTPRRFAEAKSTLKEDIPSSTWESALDCYFWTSGMNEEFFESLAFDMTEYVHQQLQQVGNNIFAGYQWSKKPFTAHEVIQLLGIILNISLDGRAAGGSYRQYFYSSGNAFSIAKNQNYIIDEMKPWAKDITTYPRFTQFLGALRGDISRPTGVEDKGFQLRPFINAVNKGAQRTFVPGRDLAFDEGGVGCRSRRCPIRQYNKDKPKKFRVDFFILACSRMYFIFHIDVYLGKNGSFINVHEEARPFPTTQRVMINAILQSKIANSPDGWRCVWMDSRYSSPLSFQMCKESFKVLCGGTVRMNRKGWDKDTMNLSKSSARGTTLMKYDKVLEQVAIQWNDNKVVSFITTMVDFQLVDVKRRKGRTILNLQVPKPLKLYQENMGGVDRGDQIRETSGGGFFKGVRKLGKWYKKPILGILDIGTVNSHICWNMRADMNDDVHKTSYARFQSALAQDMMNFVPKRNQRQRQQGEQDIRLTSDDGCTFNMPQSNNSYPSNVRCLICRLEQDLRRNRKRNGGPVSVPRGSRGPKNIHHLGYCTSCQGAYLHGSSCPENLVNELLLFSLPEFVGKSCFDIFHHPSCKGM